MDSPFFISHYRSLVQKIRFSGLPTPWLKKTSMVSRVPFLLYDALLILLVMYAICVYFNAIISGEETFEELCLLGIGAALLTCSFLEVLYHFLYHHELKKVTDEMDRLMDSFLNSDIGDSQFLLDLNTKIAKSMALLTRNTFLFCVICPFMYCLPVPVFDSLAGEYRSRLPIPVLNPFDDKQPVVYEIIALGTACCLAISSAKKGSTDCLFLTLFKVHTCFLEYLSHAMEESHDKFLFNGKGADREKLAKWIDLHQGVLRNIQDLVSAFSPIIIIYYVSLLILIVCGLFTQTMKNSDNFVQSFGVGSYIFLSIYHLFLLSDTAEDLSSKAQSTAFAAYDVPWYKMTKKEKDMLLMVITIANRPIHVTAYRAPLFLLNRETFAGFIKCCTSAFVTLVQMMNRFR